MPSVGARSTPCAAPTAAHAYVTEPPLLFAAPTPTGARTAAGRLQELLDLLAGEKGTSATSPRAEPLARLEPTLLPLPRPGLRGLGRLYPRRPQSQGLLWYQGGRARPGGAGHHRRARRALRRGPLRAKLGCGRSSRRGEQPAPAATRLRREHYPPPRSRARTTAPCQA